MVLRCPRCSESNSALPFKAQGDLRTAAVLWGVCQSCTPFWGHCRIVFCTALQADALGHCWIRAYGALGRRKKSLNFNKFRRKKIPFCTGWNMTVLATLQPKSSYRLQWLSNTCPNCFSQLICCGKRDFAPKGGNQGICFIDISFPSVIVSSWGTSLPIQSSKHQVLIVDVLALDHNHKKRKSSLCCGPFGCWQYLEMQSHASGACVV